MWWMSSSHWTEWATFFKPARIGTQKTHFGLSVTLNKSHAKKTKRSSFKHLYSQWDSDHAEYSFISCFFEEMAQCLAAFNFMALLLYFWTCEVIWQSQCVPMFIVGLRCWISWSSLTIIHKLYSYRRRFQKVFMMLRPWRGARGGSRWISWWGSRWMSGWRSRWMPWGMSRRKPQLLLDFILLSADLRHQHFSSVIEQGVIHPIVPPADPDHLLEQVTPEDFSCSVWGSALMQHTCGVVRVGKRRHQLEVSIP